MTDDMTLAKELLIRDRNTLVVCKNGKVYISKDRGIRPLIDLIESKEDLRGAVAADKVVGKAAALLYALMGVKAVCADTLGESAVKVFEKHSIGYHYRTLTESIINRQKTGLCPMEQTVLDIDDPKAALSALKQKVEEMRNG